MLDVMAPRRTSPVTAKARASTVVSYGRGETVFVPGDVSAHVMFIRSGGVQLSVVSGAGIEAVVAVLGPGDFFGERCLAGQPVRAETATAIAPSTILRLPKAGMAAGLGPGRELSSRFVAYVLRRNSQMEEDLIGRLFQSSESRLARALLVLARYGHRDGPLPRLPPITRQRLAQTIGATRSQVDVLLGRFRKLGYIDYEPYLTVNHRLLRVVLED
jgi:CRP/FNR family transcriptional regulator, cyclic AMP receptor protein